MKKLVFVVLSFFLFLGEIRAITKAPVDVTGMSINELLNAMENGYLTSEMLVNIYLERINTYDKDFNAISEINSKALDEAKELDEMRRNGNIKGRLHGIPIVVKSNIDVVGLSTNAGTKALKENFPDANSEVVQRLVDEGAIILGSCNMSALAFSAQSSYGSFGHVYNAFDVSKTPFGSSGGSAVAVSVGFAVAALGTDTNSSVRAPAMGAGLVGIRPTYGLVSHTGILPYDYERDTVGVLSKNVSDNALLLEIISGKDEKDETTSDAKSVSYNLSKKDLKGMKIGVLTQYVKGSVKESGVTGETDSDIYNLLEKSIKRLESAGAELVYLDNFVKYSNITIASSTMAGGTLCDYFNEYVKGTTGPIKSFKDLAHADGIVWDLSGYVKSCGEQVKTKESRDKKKQIYRDHVQNYFDEYNLDVMLYPTIKNKVPLEKGSSGNILPGSTLSSVIGYPSITVPMGKLSDGMSYGIEFLGQRYDEQSIYQVSGVFEYVNNNEIKVSPLTPSLYEIPDEVTKLVKVYEENLSKGDKEWLSEVSEYFKTYNEIEDVKGRALELLEEYDNMSISLLNNKDKLMYWITIGIIVVCFLIIIKNIVI